MMTIRVDRLRYKVVSLAERRCRPHTFRWAYRSLTMISKAGEPKEIKEKNEIKQAAVDMKHQEECNDESGEHQRPATTRLFSSLASTLLLAQLEQLTSQP